MPRATLRARSSAASSRSRSPARSRQREGKRWIRGEGREGVFFAWTSVASCCKVQPQNIARYSLPEEALSYVPEEAAVVMPFANGDKERLISCNIEPRPIWFFL